VRKNKNSLTHKKRTRRRNNKETTLKNKEEAREWNGKERKNGFLLLLHLAFRFFSWSFYGTQQQQKIRNIILDEDVSCG
jgi:hypothetical protein